MATARSILGGIGIAAGGATATYLLTSYLDNTAGSGTVAYLNEVVRGVTNILRPAGYAGFPLLGAWYAFLSDEARGPHPPPGMGPPGAHPRIRRMRGRFRGDIDIR